MIAKIPAALAAALSLTACGGPNVSTPTSSVLVGANVDAGEGNGVWSAVSVLKSPIGCRTAPHVYTFRLAGDTLYIDSDLGMRNEPAQVVNGEVNHSFVSPSGAGIRVHGNVHTKQMSVFNDGANCEWALSTIQQAKAR